MSKNIVIFSDGTGQEGGKGNNTNVYKLFNMVEDRTERQITFYDRGIGTGTRKILSNAGGKGISKNIKECYQFIFEHFEAGDRIYLFGFSRGAATVRSLASFIELFGILPKSRPELISRAYSIYRKKDRREELAKAFVARNHTMWTKIHFIGVWDTVAALGMPIKWLDPLVNRIPAFRHLYHDFGLKKGVRSARHALAIDDVRKSFHPTFMYPYSDQDVKQVWFSGMHTDVGGGYKGSELSDIALEWLSREAITADLLIYPDNHITLKPEPNGFMHDSRDTWLKQKIYPIKRRNWPAEKLGVPVVHKSVIERVKNVENTESPVYKPWILKEPYTIET